MNACRSIAILLCLLAPVACEKSSPNASPAPPAPMPSAVPAVMTAIPIPPKTKDPAADDLVGKPAPDFTQTAHDGTVVQLSKLRGKPVVVYFYPKDETPGCTKEACALRDSWQPIQKTGAVILGVSADTRDSHVAFASHHKLPFLLLSDPEGTLARAYGVPFLGIHKRQTVVIGKDGVVRKVYRSVDVGAHAEQILSDVQNMP
jgi:peroxiredoxin Q/BCP